MNQLPKLDEQAKAFLEDKVKPFEFYNEETKEWLSADSDKWQKATLEKFAWIRSHHSIAAEGEQLTPGEYALMSDNDNIEIRDFVAIKNKSDKLRVYITESNAGGKQIVNLPKTTVIPDYPQTFSWRDLFLKLVFE